MDVFIPAPLPEVDASDLIERLNAREVTPLAFEYAREYASKGRKARVWTAKDFEQIKREVGTYPLFAFLLRALTRRVVMVRSGHPPAPAPLRAAILEKDVAPYRAALDWLALAGLVQAGTRLGICPAPDCGKFFADVKHRGKAACSPKCASRIRFQAHYAKLSANPRSRKYRQHLKRQREFMRDYRRKKRPA